MTQSAIEVLDELEQTSGSLAKRDILELNRKNDLLKRAFVATGDPYTTYNVNKFKMPPPKADRPWADDDVLDCFLSELLPRLASRKVTGNAARDEVVAEFADMTALQQKWCQRILIRNLRCGVQESTVNKVWPGSLQSFKVALACTLKSDFVKGDGIRLLELVSYPVRVEPKLDGLRCIAVKKDGAVTFYTRNGTVLETMPKIRAVLTVADYDNAVLDGEMMGRDWAESASVVMARKSQHDDSNMVYHVFDAMPLADWVAQDCSMPYRIRLNAVSTAVMACEKLCRGNGEVCPVHQVPHVMAKDEAQLKAYFADCMNSGYEGVMLKRMDTTYEWDRSKNILKLKPTMTHELVVVGNYEGRRGTKNEGKWGGFTAVSSNGVITRIGGGFNDAFKADVQLQGPDTFIGKVIECECQPDPCTRDGLTEDGKLRFPVFCRFRDESDVDPKLVEAGQKAIQLVNGKQTGEIT